MQGHGLWCGTSFAIDSFEEIYPVLGWTILFALMALPGVGTAVSRHPAASLEISSFVFAVLFLLALFTQAMRSRAR